MWSCDWLVEEQVHILQDTLPVCSLKHKDECDYAFIDKMLTVCAARNLSPSVVPA